jgi:hypothetical protein
VASERANGRAAAAESYGRVSSGGGRAAAAEASATAAESYGRARSGGG